MSRNGEALAPLPQFVPTQLRELAEDARRRMKDPFVTLELNPLLREMWLDAMLSLLAAAKDLDARLYRRAVRK